jgi:hypothetical protein
MCIYYAGKSELKYTKQEHIFPAGLGGKEKLPLGWVSDQANELFSPMERQLMRDSLISLERMLFGPGKRGTLSSNKASQSNVAVGQDDDGQISLSYTAMGTPHSISYCYRSEQHIRFNADVESGIDGFIEFVEALKNYQGRYKFLPDSIIPEEHILIGYHRGRYYVGASKKVTPERVQKEIDFILSQFKLGDVNKSANQVHQHFSMVENAQVSKVYAKTAINVLAKTLGLDCVTSDAFNDIKRWIISEAGDERYFSLPQIETSNPLKLPDKCHWCIVQPFENELVATVCFYNAHYRRFILSNIVPNGYFFPIGMICDWKNKEEYTLTDWVLQAVKIMQGE